MYHGKKCKEARRAEERKGNEIGGAKKKKTVVII